MTRHQTPFLIPVQKQIRRTDGTHETLEWLQRKSMADYIEGVSLLIRVFMRSLALLPIPSHASFSSLHSHLGMFRCNHCRDFSQSAAIPPTLKQSWNDVPLGMMMISRSTMIPTMIQILIFIFFHHICLRTLFAPRRKPWADWLRFSDLSWSWSMCSPRWATDSRFFFITLTVSSICYIWALISNFIPPSAYTGSDGLVGRRCTLRVTNSAGNGDFNIEEYGHRTLSIMINGRGTSQGFKPNSP